MKLHRPYFSLRYFFASSYQGFSTGRTHVSLAAPKIRSSIIFILVLLLTQMVSAAKHEPSKDEKAHLGIVENMPLVEGKLGDYVKQVGQRIVSHLERNDDTFTFTIIDDPNINAFALEGGYIYIHRGLIAYLKSEAQLAAILAHEVGHITGNHHGRQKRAQVGSQITTGVLAVLTGSIDVAEAGAYWGASLVSGYGREMELEADELGSQYLLQAGYDPQAMIEVITLLKDHERFEQQRAKALGKEAQSYHGLFATHPRNDQRLREVVNKSGHLPTAIAAENNITPFRIATEGMTWGESDQASVLPDNAYRDSNLAFQVNFPKNWTYASHDSTLNSNKRKYLILAQNTQNNARLHLSIMARTVDTPDQFINKQLNLSQLKKSESFAQSGLKGHTGFISQTTLIDQRIAVIYYGRRAYIFRGEIDSGANQAQADKDFIYITKSFRPMSERVLTTQAPKTIHYVKATSNTTFPRLARYLKLGKFGEDELRIINGYYPSGEPKSGEWIKLIQ